MEGMIELPGGGYDLLLFKGMSTAQKRQFDKQHSSNQFTLLEESKSSLMAADEGDEAAAIGDVSAQEDSEPVSPPIRTV